MRNGKKFSAGSLLSILGAVCFATIIVAAALVTSNSLTFTGTPVKQGSIQLSATTTPGEIVLGNTATYVLKADVSTALISDAKIVIKITKSVGTGLNASDIDTVTAPTITYGALGSPETLSFSFVTDHLEATYNIATGAQAVDHNVPVTIVLKYTVTGTFDVQATMSGTA
jgi:hypothetical protein